jgi:hypothetical protein
MLPSNEIKADAEIAKPKKSSVRLPSANIVEMRQTAVAEARCFWQTKMEHMDEELASIIGIDPVLDSAERILSFYLTGKAPK